jgi:hypothetical protein
MAIKTENRKKIVITDDCLKKLSRDAFYGSNEQFADLIKAALSCEEGGRIFPANGFSLSDAITAVKEMDAKEVLECVERMTVRLMHDDGDGKETELLHGDKCSIAVIYFNITGRNFEGRMAEHTSYLDWVKKTLPYPSLDTQKVFILVK